MSSTVSLGSNLRARAPSRSSIRLIGSSKTSNRKASSRAQQPGESSGNFVGSESQDSGEYLQKSGNPESGFAEEGQGAPDQGDIERGTERSQNRESDIEGSSDSNA